MKGMHEKTGRKNTEKEERGRRERKSRYTGWTRRKGQAREKD